MSSPHWHIASGLAGYGPDNDGEGFSRGEDAITAAMLARDELLIFADMAYEEARSYADAGDYESAWKTQERSNNLDLLARNLDAYTRKDAPIYRNDPEALERSMRAIIEGYTDTAGTYHSGAPWDVSDNARLYVWECNEAECDEDEGDQ